MTSKHPGMSPDEAARRWALEQAEHSGEMEGLHVDPETLADGEEYAAGRIDVDEFVAVVRARYGLK
jgi:hypothetical protein